MKKALVIGMGKSGKAAMQLLKKQGYEVEGVDSNPDLGFASKVNMTDFESIVVSPGVAPENQFYQAARTLNKTVLGEAELALKECRQPCIAITGTNGKTTVTLLVTHILNYCNIKARALGNVGSALSTYFLDPNPLEILVVELSSFQLETLTSQIFDSGIVLNITPDHLDRYRVMDEYARAKCRLQYCLKKNAPLYVNYQILTDFNRQLKIDFISYGKDHTADIWTDGHNIYRSQSVVCSLPERYSDMGIHDSENALAAWLLCEPFGVTNEKFKEALESFQKPPHRLEWVSTIKEVDYYNDSKGTNIDATIQAVKAMQKPIYLIVGGVDKGFSYLSWVPIFKSRVKKIFVIGQATKKICSELQNHFPVMIVDTLENAVKNASQEAPPGSCILLSPGCASYDMFRDYVHRGEVFKQYVQDLK